MKTRLTYLIVVLASCWQINAFAQSLQISFDKDSILIGDHLLLNIKVLVNKEDRIFLPEFADTIGNFDLIEIQKPDTIENGISQNILLTQFNEGNYLFGGIPVLIQTSSGTYDTLRSNDVMLYVSTVEVDTTQAFKPIKDVKALPFPWKYFLKKSLFIIIPLLILLILLIWYLVRKKKIFAVPEKPKTMLDYYDEAMTALQDLDNKKLWQNDHIKEYYLGVSEILRTYLEGRFGVNAMESTTDEIREELFLEDGFKNKVCDILAQADLAKFAKFKPLNDENLKVMKLAKDFVQHTKPKSLETTND